MSTPAGYVWAWPWSLGPRLSGLRVYPTVDDARRWWAEAFDDDPTSTQSLELYSLHHVVMDADPGLSFTEREADRNARGGS